MKVSSFLTLCLFACQSSLVAAAAISIHKRDDGLPARVPYVFPPPGTNEVSDYSSCCIAYMFDNLWSRLRMRFANAVIMELY